MALPSKENSARARSRVDTVLFDYGLVLTGPPNPAAWAQMREVSVLTEDALHEAYWHFHHDYDRGALNGCAYWNAVAERVRTSFNPDQIAALEALDVDLWTVPNQPMIAWAQRLQRAGVRTGILSNIGDAIAKGIVERLPWLAEFYHCTWSHALSLAKPDPEIYCKTAELLHTPPERILFFDDRGVNVEAAKSLGMQAVHYTTQDEFERAMQEGGYGMLLKIGLVPATPAMQPA